MTGWMRTLLSALCLIVLLAPAHAVEPGEMLKDPALEARARAISQELRCVVCQNQSIDDSNAPLAHDLRVIVRERLSAGDSDQAVLAFVVARYGEFVLLRPRLEPQTLLLWLAPLLLLAGAALALLRYFKQRALTASTDPIPLTRQEQKRLDEVLLGSRDGPN
jgi:cytochrome c-type biogenesis protein CcmH